MRRRVFEPLGMATAGFGPPRGDQPRGHKPDGTPVEPGLGADNPAAIGPAGIVHCSFDDWAKYVALHLRFDAAGTRKAEPAMEKMLRIVKPETLRRLHDARPEDDPRYAMGWVVADREWAGGRVLTHNGSNTMWFVVAWLATRRDFAVLVGANQGGPEAEKACDEAAWSLIRDHLKADK